MITVLGGMIGGIGILFFGMWLLSENLKTVAGPRLRVLVGRLTGNRFVGFGFGVLAGATTQSGVAVTSITVSMLKSELITARQGFLIVMGAQLGVPLMILVITLDIKLVAVYGLGLAGHHYLPHPKGTIPGNRRNALRTGIRDFRPCPDQGVRRALG